MTATGQFFCKTGVLLLTMMLFSLAVFLSVVQGQGTVDVTAVPRATDSFEVTAERAGDGTCQCTVKSPALVLCTDYQTLGTAEKLRDIQDQISNLTADVNTLYEVSKWHSQLIGAFETNLSEVTSTFDLIEGGRVLVTRVEIEGVRTRIYNMESALHALREWQGVESDVARNGWIQAAMNQASNISQIVDAMAAQDNRNDFAAMQREIFQLTSQLETCHAQTSGDAPTEAQPDISIPTASVAPPAPATNTSGRNPLDETVPERWPAKPKQNSCGRLLTISEPYTVRGNLNNNGAWMKDPLVNPDFVYYHSFIGSSSSKGFKGSASVAAFQRDETHAITGDNLDYILEAVVYNESLFAYSYSEQDRYYYHGSRDANIYRKLSKIGWSHSQAPFPTFSPGRLITQRTMTSSNRLDRFAYSAPDNVPKMDLTVDETGLWALYSDSLGMLVVSKIDQDTLEFERSWEGSYPKNRLANCFVICRRVYCLKSYTRFDSRVSYYMDTDTGFEGFTNIPFIIKYGSLSSIEYNPHDQMLYGWDKSHAVVYSLTFE